MKKYLLSLMLILISLIIPSNVYAISISDAYEKIDITRDSKLTLNYYYDDDIFDNTNVKIYYIASITSDFNYQLSSDFSDYPIKINDITTTREWTSLEATLNNYIETDNINEIASYTIKNNQITISNLKTGLYFIKTEPITTEDYTIIFDDFLVSVPTLNKDGTWNYDVNAYPKLEKNNKPTNNTISNYHEKNPTTYDDIKVYLYLFVISFIVVILLTISLIKYKKSSK